MLEVRPRHLLLVLAAQAIALATGVALVVRGYFDEPLPSYLSMALIGIGFGWVGLAGCYLALGRQKLVVRLGISTLVALAGGAVCALAEEAPDMATWCGVMLFNAFVVAVPLIYLWARGLRLTHPEHPPLQYWKSNPQFSLWGLLSAMTCAAMLLAIAVRLRFPLDSLYAVMIICGCTGGIVYVAAATLLSRIPFGWAMISISMAAIVAAGALHTLGPLPVGKELMTASANAAVVTIWALVLRTAGYFLHWPDYSTFETVGPSKRLVDEQGRPVEATLPMNASTKSSTAIEDRQS